MSTSTLTVETLAALARQLPPTDRARLISEVSASLAEEPQSEKKPRRSLYGLLADLGLAPSAEDIDEARRDMLSNFPREDI